MRARRLIQALLATLLCVSCGGGGSSGGTPNPTPTAPTPPAATVVTITISGANGAQSFSPNPAMCATGQTVVWKNADSVTHRVEIDELWRQHRRHRAGRHLGADVAWQCLEGYRCTLHPQMVGALNGAATPTPPSDGPGCGPYGC